MMMDSSAPSPPPMDPAQQALEQQQTSMLQQQSDLLNQQVQQQKIIEPFLFQSMGLNPTYDNSGKLTGLTQNPDVKAFQDLQLKVNTETLQQQQDALEGKLPVNPLVMQELQRGDQQLNDTLSNNLGPGYAASTPGQEALQNRAVTRAGIIQGANTGQMSLDAQLAGAGVGNYGSSLGQVLSGVTGVNELGFNTAGAFGQVAAGYGVAQQPFEALAANRYNYSSLGVQAQESNNASIGAGVGTAVGIGAAAVIF